MKSIKTLFLTMSLFFGAQAQAGFITIDEFAFDNIFSQSSFANMPIDIRIGAATELVFPSLLDIDLIPEVGQLFAQHVGGANVVNFYFIDTLSACGSINPLFAGCGEYPGNDFVVESGVAAGPNGTELLAHELGHNLGLGHRSGSGNLMDPTLNNGVTLNDAEVTTIRTSNLVQTDGSSFWIDINPVLIVAQATNPLPVPEPSTMMLLLLSFGLLWKGSINKSK
jgi:hypothetical protein